MDDLISRKALLEAVNDCHWKSMAGNNWVRKEELLPMIERLPSGHTQQAADLISRQAAIDAFNVGTELLRRVLDDADVVGTERAKYEWGLGLIESYISDMKDLPSAKPDRSLWFRIGEICVDESKGFISAGRAVEKIRELLREVEGRARV